MALEALPGQSVPVDRGEPTTDTAVPDTVTAATDIRPFHRVPVSTGLVGPSVPTRPAIVVKR